MEIIRGEFAIGRMRIVKDSAMGNEKEGTPMDMDDTLMHEIDKIFKGPYFGMSPQINK